MNQRGFTLIELMIVVAMVGILAAILLPAFFGDRTASQTQFPQGTVVQSVTVPTYTCENGILIDGQHQPFVQNGVAVKCP